jgi:hypothetical protein
VSTHHDQIVTATSGLSGIGTKTAAGKLPESCLALTCALITKYFPQQWAADIEPDLSIS